LNFSLLKAAQYALVFECPKSTKITFLLLTGSKSAFLKIPYPKQTAAFSFNNLRLLNSAILHASNNAFLSYSV